MHLYQLPPTLRDALLSPAFAQMRVIAQVNGYMKVSLGTNAQGVPVMSSGYPYTVWLDVNRLSDAPITISRQKPILPSDGTAENTISAGEVTLQFLNTDEYFAVTQHNAIFDPERIEQTTVTLYLQVGTDVATRMLLYRGRVIGLPMEEAGITTITIRDLLYGIIREPVLYEKFAFSQQAFVSNLQLYPGSFAIGPTGDEVSYYDGIITFAQSGETLASLSNSKPDDVDIRRITIGNMALPGKYILEFTDSTRYRITYPDNAILTGDIGLNYPSNGATNHSIKISQADWSIVGDPTGAKLEWYVSAVFSGNPVTAIMNILEKGFTGAWGTLPTQSAAIPIDWPKFILARNFYSGWKVYVDATNKDNKVWGKRRGNKPLSCLQLAQQIADHIGCQIVVDNYGMVSIVVPGIFPEIELALRDVGPEPAIMSVVVDAQQRSNFLKLNYGFNNLGDSFSTHLILDNRLSANDDKEELTINFPFYKQDLSLYEMQRVGGMINDRIAKSFTRLTLKVKPNWGVSIIPGDRFRVITSEQPRLDMYVEVYKVDATIGGEVVVGCIKVSNPLTNVSTICEAVICEAVIC